MAERVVGLDIGTRAVRVADVEPGPRPVLRAFGQVDLPLGAVRAGEVLDIETVAEAIRRVWRETGLRGRTAYVGVASDRVVVRTIELPAVPDDELAGALRFQAQDYIPIPVDEAVIDFHVLERVTGPDGEPLARILLTAAPRQTVVALLAAVQAAGITALGVDLVPLALIRSLGAAPAEHGSADAIVSVGAGVTTVVVHQAGVPKLVRIVATGNDAVADDGAIHGSLDHYLNQPDALPMHRILLTGGGSLAAGLTEALATSLGVPVEQAQPREMIDVADLGIPEERIPDLDPYLPVAVGLALGGRREQGVHVDLLPPEARREASGRRTRRRLVVAGAAVLLMMAGLSLFQVVGAAGQRDRLAGQQRTNRALQAQIDALSGTLQGEEDLARARKGVTAALAGDVSWPRVLEDLAGTLPEGVWLTNLNIQPASAGGTLGTASFGVTGLTFPDVAAWLDRLPRIPYYENVFVTSATRAEGPVPLVSFTSGAGVGPAAGSDRLQRILGSQP